MVFSLKGIYKSPLSIEPVNTEIQAKNIKIFNTGVIKPAKIIINNHIGIGSLSQYLYSFDGSRLVYSTPLGFFFLTSIYFN